MISNVTDANANVRVVSVITLSVIRIRYLNVSNISVSCIIFKI